MDLCWANFRLAYFLIGHFSLRQCRLVDGCSGNSLSKHEQLIIVQREEKEEKNKALSTASIFAKVRSDNLNLLHA